MIERNEIRFKSGEMRLEFEDRRVIAESLLA